MNQIMIFSKNRPVLLLLILLGGIIPGLSTAQPLKYSSSSEILLQIKKLNVLGSALYIAAHPDDENTRLIAYLSGERLLRTGYLSLTRGDGGQNLIGEELGISLGLIRTQELLAARRIDGADQFFTRAYDFGFSKNPEETFAVWNKEKILGDAVRVIRSFKPDIIIARFPEDERAGHGHHSASGIVAREAFYAAADPLKFPDQLKEGLTVWQAKRLLWNTFSFGGNSTIREDQFKFDVGAYNPLLGKSYGEISALSRSEHKSQGFGVPTSRGEALEYFETIAGEKPTKDILEGVITDWSREGLKEAEYAVRQIIETYDASNPQGSVPALLNLYKLITGGGLSADELNNQTLKGKYSSWRKVKANEIAEIIKLATGFHFEATANRQFAVEGDSLQVRFSVVNRSDIAISNIKMKYNGEEYSINNDLKNNIPAGMDIRHLVIRSPQTDQPYWLQSSAEKGSFNVDNKDMIGLPQNPSGRVQLDMQVEGITLSYTYPLIYKYTDPVRGEVRQPVITVPAIVLTVQPDVVLAGINTSRQEFIKVQLQTFGKTGKQSGKIIFKNGNSQTSFPFSQIMEKDKFYTFSFEADKVYKGSSNAGINVSVQIDGDKQANSYGKTLRVINYDHIPTVHFLQDAGFQMIKEKIGITKSRIGYIRGAGDKVPEALISMGYELVYLENQDINSANLAGFDAVITGIRAYNVHAYLTDKYDILMNYVQQGGNLIVQYNTNSMIGPVRAKISPFPFTISRGRVTNEEAVINLAIPEHKVLNYPNKISSVDFEGWVQERGLYFADKPDPAYQSPLLMHDDGETDLSGGLIVADHGKGKFIYTGISFFRQLPAGVPGAYKLMANIIGLNK